MRSGIDSTPQTHNENLISISVVIAIRQGLQVLDQISFFACTQTQVLAGVVVVDNIQQGGKAAVVIETAFGMCPQAVQRSGAITVIRRAAGLKIVNADIGGQMHVPSRLSHQRLDMATAALAFAIEYCFAARSSRGIKA